MVLPFFEALSRATCAYNCLHTCEGSGINTKGATLPLSLAFVVLPAPMFLSTPSDFSSCVCRRQFLPACVAVWQTTEKLSVPRGNDHLPAALPDSTAAAHGEFRVRVWSSQLISWTNEWFKPHALKHHSHFSTAATAFGVIYVNISSFALRQKRMFA